MSGGVSFDFGFGKAGSPVYVIAAKSKELPFASSALVGPITVEAGTMAGAGGRKSVSSSLRELTFDERELFNQIGDPIDHLKNEKSSSALTNKNDLGLCLTPDSLIHLASGVKKPLIELKVGDLVLSLNEKTQRLEPHRVLALLEMGVKPVYRITTQSGKTLKTTLTHPYLTKNGWKKLGQIKEGEEVAVVERPAAKRGKDLLRPNPDSMFFNNKEFPFKLRWREFFEKANSIIDNFFLAHIFNVNNCYAGSLFDIKAQDVAKIFVKGKQNTAMAYNIIKDGFVRDANKIDIRNFDDFKSAVFQDTDNALIDAFVSKDSHKGGLAFGNGFGRMFHKLRGVFNGGDNIFLGYPGVFFGDIVNGITAGNKIKDIAYGNAGSLDAGLAESNLGVNHDPYFMHNFLAPFLKKNNISVYPSQGKVAFEPIVKIEPLGRLQVYDIEVEGTHNFVAQGIVAHNTYSHGVSNIVSSAIDSDSGESIFKGFEGKSKAEILKEIIGSLQQKVKEIEEEGKRVKVENEEVNIFEKYIAFKEVINKNILNDSELIKKEIKKFGELLDKFGAKVIGIVKNNNEEKVFFSGVNVSIFYDLRDKLNKARMYPYYIEYGTRVENFIRVMDAYIKLLSDIQNPEKIEEGYAKRMGESRSEPELTYRLLTEYNKLSQEEKSINSSPILASEIGKNVSASIEKKGGIDLTVLPVTTQSLLNQPMMTNMPIASSALNLNINLDNEMKQIQDMLKAGITPSSERIKEYALASSSLKPEDYSREIDQLLGCIADVFRLEEEKAKPTPQILKDVLILLESDKPAQELQLALAGKW